MTARRRYPVKKGREEVAAGEKRIIKAVQSIFSELEGLDTEHQKRVLGSVMVLLGLIKTKEL